MPTHLDTSSPGMNRIPTKPAHIGIVDDDTFFLDLASTVLTTYGFRVSTSIDTKEFWKLWKSNHPDLIILDLNLPDGNGMDICRDLRAVSSVPILILTSRSDEIERVVGLEMGADDYLVKPIFPRELVARVKTILRRTNKPPANPEPLPKSTTHYHFSGWMLTTASRQLVAPDGSETTLSEGECRLLTLFLTHPQTILSREQIMTAYGMADANPLGRSVDNMISRLRKRLRDTAAQGKIIETVRGNGYRLLVTVDSSNPSSTLACALPVTATVRQEALILTHDATIGFILETMLNQFGLQVVLLPMEKKSIRLCKERNCVIILLDCDGSDPDALALAKEIRAASTGCPVVALEHAWIPEGASEHPLALVADDLLATPIRFADLHAMLSRHMPHLTSEVPAALSCMDLVLAAELKNLAGKQNFLRFLHLFGARILAHRSAIKQAALAHDRKALTQETNLLYHLAVTVGSQRLIAATSGLLDQLAQKNKNIAPLVSMVDIACELTDSAISASRLLTQREMH